MTNCSSWHSRLRTISYLRNGADGDGDIEGKVARVATRELGNERVSICGSKTFPKFVSIRVHSWLRLLDYVLYVEMGRMIPIRSCHQSLSCRAKFFHGLLRADIVFSHEEHHVLNKLERMSQQ